MKKEPNQYTEPFNATLSNSEELHGHPKVGVYVLSALISGSNVMLVPFFSQSCQILLDFKEKRSVFCLSVIDFLVSWSKH